MSSSLHQLMTGRKRIPDEVFDHAERVAAESRQAEQTRGTGRGLSRQRLCRAVLPFLAVALAVVWTVTPLLMWTDIDLAVVGSIGLAVLLAGLSTVAVVKLTLSVDLPVRDRPASKL